MHHLRPLGEPKTALDRRPDTIRHNITCSDICTTVYYCLICAPCPERWPSGLRRTPGKCVYVNPYRGFESLSLRQSRFFINLCMVRNLDLNRGFDSRQKRIGTHVGIARLRMRVSACLSIRLITMHDINSGKSQTRILQACPVEHSGNLQISSP